MEKWLLLKVTVTVALGLKITDSGIRQTKKPQNFQVRLKEEALLFTWDRPDGQQWDGLFICLPGSGRQIQVDGQDSLLSLDLSSVIEFDLKGDLYSEDEVERTQMMQIVAYDRGVPSEAAQASIILPKLTENE